MSRHENDIEIVANGLRKDIYKLAIDVLDARGYPNTVVDVDINKDFDNIIITAKIKNQHFIGACVTILSAYLTTCPYNCGILYIGFISIVMEIYFKQWLQLLIRIAADSGFSVIHMTTNDEMYEENALLTELNWKLLETFNNHRTDNICYVWSLNIEV